MSKPKEYIPTLPCLPGRKQHFYKEVVECKTDNSSSVTGRLCKFCGACIKCRKIHEVKND